MSNGQLFHCITAPCGSGTGAPGNPFVPFSTSPGIFARGSFGGSPIGDLSISPAIDMALLAAQSPGFIDLLQDTFRAREAADEAPPEIGGELPVALPPPVRPPPRTVAPPAIAPEEMASIDEQLRVAEESERPIVRVTEQEREEFLRDRDSILARTGRDPDSLPPSLNPILLVSGTGIEPDDEPPEAEEPDEFAVVVRPPFQNTGPPVFLGDLAEVTGEIEPDPRPDRFEGEQMADLSDIFGAIGDRIVGSLDFDPSTPGIFGGGATSSLPDVIADQFFDTTPTVAAPAPRSTPVQVNIDPVTGKMTRCHPRRRRRRLLTKSDIADISTMAALLGKNSESFKVWLAKATR